MDVILPFHETRMKWLAFVKHLSMPASHRQPKGNRVPGGDVSFLPPHLNGYLGNSTVETGQRASTNGFNYRTMRIDANVCSLVG